MPLLLEFQSGPTPVPRIWLRDGQDATVGRTPRADYSIEGDGQMSSVHFRIECRTERCRVRDLKSTNGTFVNGERIEDATLRNGDLLLAGKTTFTVRIGDAAFGTGASTNTAATSPLPATTTSLPSTPSIQEAAESPASPPAPIQATIRPTANRIELLCLETGREPHARKIWLRPGQSSVVGRAELNDFSVPEDQALSRSHFQISCTYEQARVKDLGSSGGTFVNEKPAKELALRDGDRIRAGATEFQVRVRYEHAESASRPVAAAHYRAVASAGGVIAFRGCDPELTWLRLVPLLIQQIPAHAVLNFAGLEVKPPLRPTYLLNWLAPAAAAQLSPVVLSPLDLPATQPFLEAAWGQDAMVIVFSRQEGAQLLETLRLAARGQTRAAGYPRPEQMLSSFRPSEVSRVLTAGLIEFVRFFFEAIDGILIESKEGPSWEILAGPGFAEILDRAGLVGARAES